MPITKRPGHWGDPMWLADAIRAFGVRVEERPGWRTWGNGDFRQVKGVMAHHTGHNATSVHTISFGHSALRGLLSQVHLDRTGLATMCGVGIAYHAGVGSWPGIATNAANWEMVGIEAQSDGSTPWPPEMLDAYYRICAAICWVLDRDADWLIAHHEWAGRSQGKWDPGENGQPMNMGPFRDRVQHYINHPPFIEEDADMAFWDEQVHSLVDPEKAFPRRDFIELTDYHATLANKQSRQALDELALMREDLRALAEAQTRQATAVERIAASLLGENGGR